MAFPTKAMIFTGLHCSDNVSAWLIGDRRGFVRDTASYARRRTEIIADANAESCDLAVNLGDDTDGGATKANKLTLFQATLADFDANLNCEIIHAIGNHTVQVSGDGWDGVGGNPTMSQYFDALDASTSEGAKANFYGPDNEAYCYEYTDTNGMVWICLFFSYSDVFDNDGPGYDYMDWLDTRLQVHSAAGTPCVVVAHAHLWQNANNSNPNGLRVEDADWASLQPIFDAAETLQIVFGGHQHAGGAWMKRNGVWFLDVEGSVSMPPDQTATGNAYMIVTINPQQIWTPYGMKAQVKVEPYGFCRVDKPNYDKFAAA